MSRNSNRSKDNADQAKITDTPSVEPEVVNAADPDRETPAEKAAAERTEDNTVYVRGESGVVWPHTLPLSDAVLDQLATGKAQRVNKDGTPWQGETHEFEPVTAEVPPGPGREPLSVEERNAARSRGIDVDGPHNVVEVRAQLALSGDVTRAPR